MNILLDHCVDRRLARQLTGHAIKTTRDFNWELLRNGDLLHAAATVCDVFITVDKKLRFEQNLHTLPLPIVVLDVLTSTLKSLLMVVPPTLTLLSTTLARRLYVVRTDGVEML